MHNPAPTPAVEYFGGGARDALRNCKSGKRYDIPESVSTQSIAYTPTSLVKIGITYDPKGRFETLKKEYPYLEMMFCFCLPNREKVFEMEKHLHQVYDRYNLEFVINGKRRTEWFEMSRTQAKMLIGKLNNAEWSLLGLLGKVLI